MNIYEDIGTKQIDNEHIMERNQEQTTQKRRNQEQTGKAKRKHFFKTKMTAILLALCIVVSGATSAGVSQWVSGQQYETAQVTTIETSEPYVQLTSTLASGTTSIADTVDKSAVSVVEISTETTQTNPNAMQFVTEGAGSGVILTADGYIVTNYHVIDGASDITVRLTDGTEYKASLIGSDATTDLAVLKIEATGLTAATFADSDTIRVGDMAIAIGNPLGELGGTVTDGIISALDREIAIDGNTMTLLQTSAAVNPGNSGGGLFDSNGNLVGIVNAKSSGTGIEGLAFAIPANTVTEIVQAIMENGYVTGRPQLGIQVTEISDQRTAAMYRLQVGVYVAQNNYNSSLQTGDRITAINGTTIASSADINTALSSHSVGDTVSVTVERDDASVTVKIVLTEQTPYNEAA